MSSGRFHAGSTKPSGRMTTISVELADDAGAVAAGLTVLVETDTVPRGVSSGGGVGVGEGAGAGARLASARTVPPDVPSAWTAAAKRDPSFATTSEITSGLSES